MGVVTQLFDRAPIDPIHAVAYLCGPERMMQAASPSCGPGPDARSDLRVHGAPHGVWGRALRALPDGLLLRVQGRPGVLARRAGGRVRAGGHLTTGIAWRPGWHRSAAVGGVVKLASCDGCQLALLGLGPLLLDLGAHFRIAEFGEASSERSDGPFDVLLVEGR